MNGFIGSENVLQISAECSYLGKKVFEGNAEAAKVTYGYGWKEIPALIKMNSLLRFKLTAVEIENDTNGIYCEEFLYYWGMNCLGEQSNLIVKDLGAAEICFKKIKSTIPKAEARLAFIQLLKSDVPTKSEINVARLDVLRRWAGKQDLFSMIILSRICFYEFLCEAQTDDSGLPIRVLRLLDLPCQKGHPVAIRFYNEVLAYMGTPTAIDMQIDESRINANILYDFKMSANMQIRM